LQTKPPNKGTFKNLNVYNVEKYNYRTEIKYKIFVRGSQSIFCARSVIYKYQQIFIQKSTFWRRVCYQNLIKNMARIIKFEKHDCAPRPQVSAYLNNKVISNRTFNPFDERDWAVKFKVRSGPTVMVLDGEESNTVSLVSSQKN